MTTEQRPPNTMTGPSWITKILEKYTLALRNKYEALQEQIETPIPNEEYENFVNAHLKAAVEFIPTKQRRKYRVPRETLADREKRADVKTASKCNKKNPTNTNSLKLKMVQNELANIYLKEQTEYIQNQVDKIRDSVEDRLSRIAWQTINEGSRWKSTVKAKLKATSQQDQIHLWKQHFENLLGNPPEVTQKPITRIISKQLDIKLGPFTQEELNSVRRKIKNRKAAGLDEIPSEVRRPENSTTYCSDTVMPYIIKIQLTDRWRDASSPSLKRATSD